MLPKKNRLTKEKDFQKVFKTGKSFAGKFIILKLAPNSLNFSRFGFIVGLKIAKKAVKRNKIRRQLHEILRIFLNNVSLGFDVVVLPNKEIVDRGYAEIESATKNILKKAGIWK